MITKAILRRQLRWAWAELGCRCIFNKRGEMIHEDAHCRVHGWYVGYYEASKS